MNLYGEYANVSALERVGDAYKIKITDSRQALEITNKHTEIVDFEIIKGNMDDVFLTVTGKRLGD